jgi:hypothetical protein
MKLIQNVVLDSPEDEKTMALQLIADVDLLIKRKDSKLQQFYVGILRLNKEVNVSIKFIDAELENGKK